MPTFSGGCRLAICFALCLSAFFNCQPNALLACYQGALQLDLNGAFRNEFSTGLQSIHTAADWLKLRNLMLGTITDLHYIGHGSVDRIGLSAAGSQVRLSQIQVPLLQTNPMYYVAIDGCQVVKESTAFLSALIGYTTNLTRLQCRAIGGIPAFAWGWKETKPVGYLGKGTLFDHHFYYIGDYYWQLTQRDPNTGLMNRSYKQAIDFAKDPNGASLFHNLNHNSEGNDITYVGCSGCYFDEI